MQTVDKIFVEEEFGLTETLMDDAAAISNSPMPFTHIQHLLKHIKRGLEAK